MTKKYPFGKKNFPIGTIFTQKIIFSPLEGGGGI